jgi:hypothetical protein
MKKSIVFPLALCLGAMPAEAQGISRRAILRGKRGPAFRPD